MTWAGIVDDRLSRLTFGTPIGESDYGAGNQAMPVVA
jgi:hypothetical protein